MREILFRGKCHGGEWVEGYYCGKVNKTFFSPAEDSAQIIDKDLFWHEVIPETVGQYTGLTDKNGKKIFEGDIVKGLNFLHADRLVYSVMFTDGGFYLVDEDEVPWHIDNISNVKIIGNIHDNPELLEVSDA